MTWWEYVSCLWERDFWANLAQQWTLYVELGPQRRELSRMVRGELTHIPRD